MATVKHRRTACWPVQQLPLSAPGLGRRAVWRLILYIIRHWLRRLAAWQIGGV